MNRNEIVWDPAIYPREKWSTSTIERYADAMVAGDKFPALIIESGTNKLLDGKHRLEAYKKAAANVADVEADDRTFDDVPVKAVEIPEGMSAKHYAATLSSRHGDRMSNADLEKLALEEFDRPDYPKAREWGKEFGVSERTVYGWVSHLINRARADRQTKAWRLSVLGWTNVEIGKRLDVVESTIREDRDNCEIAKIATAIGPNWNDKGVAEWANRMNVPMTDALAAAMVGLEDEARLKKLDTKVQPYDVWNFQGCHDLMGDKHPGRIPGEVVTHALWYWTKPGDLVVDPMAGSGTTLDACLLMGRKCRGYDIDLHHERVDVEQHDLSTGWPEKASKADLIFWDPPYFDKMDDGYVEGSVSKLTPDEYLQWFADRFAELAMVAKSGARLAFLMSDWDPENAKKYADHPGIYLWDYVGLLQKAGWKVRRQVQVPLPTQQVHPDIVNKFRASRRMARLGRYLLECAR